MRIAPFYFGVIAACFAMTVARSPAAEPPVEPGNSGTVSARTTTTNEADPPALSPAAGLAALSTPADLQIEQVLAEPVVRQPLSLSFDERGRLWVVEYLQYPHPAGLKMLSRDGVWRAQYDRVPPPPPNHFVGADKISIHEDSDGDGLFDRHKTFVEGLNIATSAARGRGGVWVLNPPYLLFYPDRNNDDVPDGDPEVHLEGFGLEDTHSVANSLRWGPDGWLYAAQGSTVSGSVKRPGLDKQPHHTMGQLIWRYHPETRRYEVFAEGGGNAFGVEIDSKGRIYSGHNGGNTRGFHYVQGGHFQKSFNKHGPLSNPYAFGYFNPMRHANVPRFTHTFAIYEGGTLPPAYDGKLFALSPILRYVVLSDVLPDGSSFQTKDVGMAVESRDPWFSPVDIKHGPDGALYLADWYDAQIKHFRNYEGQISKDTGRVYRLKAKNAAPTRPFDLGKLPTAELIGLLGHKNRWQRETALRLLADRKDRSAIGALLEQLFQSDGQLALESLWAINLCGGLDDACAIKALEHADPHVRLWTARLLCDAKKVSGEVAARLADLARREPQMEVRSQLACSARRLPAAQGLPIVLKLLAHGEDSGDIHIPLLLWWAIEGWAGEQPDVLLAALGSPAVWALPLFAGHVEERLMRRFASTGVRKDLLVCSQLLRLSPGEEHTKRLMAGFETALAGRSATNLPAELLEAMNRFGGGSIMLGVRQGKPEAIAAALRTIEDSAGDKNLQVRLIGVLGEVSQPGCIPTLLKIAAQSPDAGLQSAALAALQRYADPEIGKAVAAAYGNMTEDVRGEAQMLLSSRTSWSLDLLEAVDAGKIDARSIPADVIERLQLLADKRIAELSRKQWGDLKSATSAELQLEINRFLSTIGSGVGMPKAGRQLFREQCGKCHQLHGQGGKVGPDLTAYTRDKLASMLLNIVNPSAEIREGFINHVLQTTDGRTLTGLVIEQDSQSVTLRGNDGRETTLARSEIETLRPAGKSLMPEGLLRQYTDQQIRDLFAYLRSSQPLID